MSEVDHRPASTRGRSSARGGRGGFSRGGRGTSKRVNGTTSHEADAVEESIEDQGELGDMKRKYTTQLPVLKDMFADWTDVDLLFALQECDGDLSATVERISLGSVSQFAEVKKNKDRARSRVKEEPAAVEKPTGTIRGGRGRGGLEGGRGRGGRGTDRGRGGHRGGRGGHATNGVSKEQDGPSIPTTESSAWNTEPVVESTPAPTEPEQEPEPESLVEKSQVLLKKTWASMFSSAPKPTAKPTTTSAPPATEPEIEPHVEAEIVKETTPSILTEDTQPAILAAAIIDTPATTTEEASIPPPADALTQENVEHLPDESNPPATHTAASTVDSNDPRNLTPLPTQQAPIGRPPLGGFAASAQRATSGSVRSVSFQRRVLEQQEAVVMPGHSAVDRAAVQFGSMGLNGEPGLDVDEEREEPETRQAPQHSPPALPKASLPPSSRQDEATTKQAPGLPPASHQNQPQMQESALTQGLQQEQSHLGYGQGQFAGYGQSAPQHDVTATQQKPYDGFSNQTHHPQYDRFGQQLHAPQQSTPQSHSGFGGLPTGQHDYASYYGSEQHRNAYNQYYGASGNYAPQQDNRSQVQQQDSQRASSGYGAPAESAYGAQSQQQARYAENNSGHNTPNPLASGQQPTAQQSAQAMHQQQSQAHQQQQQQQQQQHPYGTNASGFPYGHPYFNSPYAQAYQNQFGFTGYGGGGGYPSKSGSMYGAPQGYAQGSYEQHSSSPANSNAFSQNQQTSMRSGSGVSTGLGGSLDEYGRNTTQASSQSAGFGGLNNDPFARTPSGFGQGGYSGQASTGVDDNLKPYSDAKTATSPAAGRPASVTNTSAAQPGQQHPQSQQGAFGGYQGYPTQSNQYGSLGGLGGHQQGQAQQGQYSGYGATGFGQYGSYNSRGGWGQTYGGGH